ncbi:MAG TPA: AIR synthase-related protein, partial [Smithellaceae bacterium]|nr:AIR synthase-related protein [Smithellaceae bacterium]HRY37616.1 AIR synthase-related protein [Smithellaceae bacterium]
IPPIFSVIQDIGHVEEKEMFRVFNMGIGMMMIVSEKESQEILNRLIMLGEKAYLIGVVEKKEANHASVCFTDI